MIPLLFLPAALATSGFDPTTPAERFEGAEVMTQDGELLLWSAIERLEDPDDTLLIAEDFNEVLAWPDESYFAPWIADCFGTNTPPSSMGLLHMAVNEQNATGTPVLLVPGAGDNASRGFITLATRLNNNTARPIYALTFAHSHGDVLRHAEMIADAIARIKERTGASQVDLVGHSKGGLAVAAYLSNHEGATWDREDHEAVGTIYRGDVRKAVFIATPLGGIDTSYRWPQSNLASLEAETAISPASWADYYPLGTVTWWTSTDLSDQDFLRDGLDPFPGHRQLLARWDDVYPLPGSDPTLGLYSLQTDWATTYYGGIGFYSESEGIETAITEGGDFLQHLQENGVDPDVELYLLAGENPLMPNGLEDYIDQYLAQSGLSDIFTESWVDVTLAGIETWGALIALLIEGSALTSDLTESEVQALAQGKLILGEVTGPSDGLVFVDSALMEETLTARGAEIADSAALDLSHLDLLYASDVTGALLLDAAAADPVSDGWLEGVGERYVSENSLLWIEEALADDVDTGTSGGTTGGTGSGTSGGPTSSGGGTTGGTTGDEAAPVDGRADPTIGGCGACSTPGSAAGAPGGWVALLALCLGWRRR